MGRQNFTDEQINGIELIGVNVQLYGHFEPFAVCDENGKPLEQTGTADHFAQRVYDYYHSHTLCNFAYGDDLIYQNQCKKFVKNRIDKHSFDIGLEWIKENVKSYFNV